MLEWIIRPQLLDRMVNNSIISKTQHGFVPKSLLWFIILFNDRTHIFDNNIPTDGIASLLNFYPNGPYKSTFGVIKIVQI